jgi:twinkle protein
MGVDNKKLKMHIPCPDTDGCGSSDAATLYDNGKTHCFSCGKTFEPDKKGAQVEPEKIVTMYRGITAETLRFYGCYFHARNGEPYELVLPHPEGAKIRTLPKQFRTSSPFPAQIFGSDKFPAGSSKAITIYEGCEDAMAGYQMQGSKYPAVSIRSSSSAIADCRAAYEYLNSFDQIYLCLDNDPQGKAASQQIAQMFPFDKIRVVKLEKYKDANDFLLNDDTTLFQKLWWNAKRYMPENILSSYDEIDKLFDEPLQEAIATYPFSKLQTMTYGIRPGEVTLIKAMEGYGKTEVMRALEYHVLKTTKERIGIIHLEESQTRTVKGLVGYELEKPVHYPDTDVTAEEMKRVYRNLTGENDRVHLYKGYGHASPDDVLNSIRFLVAACRCSIIFLDHISILVASPEVEDERLALDYLSTQLETLAQELKCSIIVVSHVNDNGQTRGSRNISKAAHLVISLHRDVTAEDEATRNITRLMIEKNRFASASGPAGDIHFDPATFRLYDQDPHFGIPK